MLDGLLYGQPENIMLPATAVASALVKYVSKLHWHFWTILLHFWCYIIPINCTQALWKNSLCRCICVLTIPSSVFVLSLSRQQPSKQEWIWTMVLKTETHWSSISLTVNYLTVKLLPILNRKTKALHTPMITVHVNINSTQTHNCQHVEHFDHNELHNVVLLFNLAHFWYSKSIILQPNCIIL